MEEITGSIVVTPIVESPVVVTVTPPVVEIMTEVIPPKVADTVDLKYRLNVYNSSGTLRSGIRSAIYFDMAKQYGDIIRSLSSTKWMTLDEVCQSVWLFDRKMLYPGNRSKQSIITALEQLEERDFVSTR